MLAKRIVPCLDVDKGRVVKGVQFLGLRDAGDPVEVAKRYDAEGADEITFLDITASHEGRDIMVKTVEKMASEVFIPLTVGGGVKTLEDIRALLNAGADKVSINTAAIKDPHFVSRAADKFGVQCIVVAVDAKRVVAVDAKRVGPVDAKKVALDSLRWEIFTHGGRNATGIDAIEWAIKMTELGAGEILLTSMDQDGTKKGYDIALLQQITRSITVPVIASGGVGTLQHLAAGILEGGADAVLAASIFHFREVTIQEAKAHLAQQGITVRL